MAKAHTFNMFLDPDFSVINPPLEAHPNRKVVVCCLTVMYISQIKIIALSHICSAVRKIQISKTGQCSFFFSLDEVLCMLIHTGTIQYDSRL